MLGHKELPRPTEIQVNAETIKESPIKAAPMRILIQERTWRHILLPRNLFRRMNSDFFEDGKGFATCSESP